MKKTLIKPALTTLMLALSATWASAGETIQIGDSMELDWSLTAAYNVGMRVAKPDPILTGEQWMWNARNNDGDNNFDRWSLVNNRVSMLLQTKLTRGDSGIVINGSTFYDDVYHNGNDNRADKFKPITNQGKYALIAGQNAPVRVSTASVIGEFTSEAKRQHGGYSRLLDVYGYTNFDLFGKRANLKIGRHVVSWGESLFFPNISMAQGPLDGGKANVPGTEIKEILLPEDQISLSWQISPKATLLANYQYGWHKTDIDAVGSYLSRSDVIGPGGICLGDFDPKAMASSPGRPMPDYCRFLPFGIVPETGSTAFASAGPGVLAGEINPKNKHSAGIGLRYRLTEQTEVGGYYLRYHERIPLPYITYGGNAPTNRAPAFWEKLFQSNIHLVGGSFTTSLGAVAVGGEVAHRRGAPVVAGGTLPPGTVNVGGTTLPFAQYPGAKPALYNPSTANLTQVNLNAFANFGRTFLAPRTLLLTEVAWVNVSGFKSVTLPTKIAPTLATPAMIADELKLYSKNNLAIQSRFQLDYPGIADGWDLSVPISYSQQLLGRNMLSNLGGKGDKILGVGLEFTRGSLQLRADYVNYLGKPSTDDLGSRVLTDRDFVSVGAKYTF